jgi:hypothetical protein
MIINNPKRMDLKEIAIRRMENLINPKFKLLKTKKIYFEKDSGEISSISCEDGYNIFYRITGGRVFPRAVNNRELIDIINCIDRGNIYSWSLIGDQKYKVRPKRK